MADETNMDKLVGNGKLHFDKFIVHIGILDTDQQRTWIKKK